MVVDVLLLQLFLQLINLAVRGGIGEKITPMGLPSAISGCVRLDHMPSRSINAVDADWGLPRTH
jgi:hypothetical protein